MAELKQRSYTMRPDGKLVVNVKALFESQRVKDDLRILREKLHETSFLRGTVTADENRPSNGS